MLVLLVQEGSNLSAEFLSSQPGCHPPKHCLGMLPWAGDTCVLLERHRIGVWSPCQVWDTSTKGIASKSWEILKIFQMWCN